MRTLLYTGLISLATLTVAAVSSESGSITSGKPTHKNIILMIPDGCGTAHTTLARLYKGSPLAVDSLAGGLCRTHSANAVITGSAAAGTALACGIKTEESDDGIKMLGLYPSNRTVSRPDTIGVPANAFSPVPSILEGAKLLGKATGIVATARFSHATPAAFLGHFHDRNAYDLLARQMYFSNPDILFAGGKDLLDETKNKGINKTTKDLGYDFFVTDRAAFDAVTSGRGIALFGSKDMAKDLDRDLAKEPSLAEMTSKSIDLLSKDQDGFFLIVEGSQVDWSSHANDPVGVATEFIAFDKAVSVAKKFVEKNPNTLLIVLPDHDNGGMSIYSDESKIFLNGKKYTSLQPSDVTVQMKKATKTAEWIALKITKDSISDPEKLRSLIAQFYGINDLTDNELALLTAEKNVEKVLGQIMSRRTYIGWTTDGHTGNDVPLWYAGVSKPLPVMNNTDIAELMFRSFGIDRTKLEQNRFVESSKLFPSAKQKIDTARVAYQGLGTLTVISQNDTVQFELNSTIARKNGTEIRLDGLAVYSPITNKVFLPRSAEKLLIKK